MAHSDSGRKPTKLFKFYSVNLVIRAIVLVAAVLAATFDPVQLSITESFGFAHGITLIDIIFVLLIVDGLTKLFPNAKIAVGSLKQFRQYHVPTPKLLLAQPARLKSALREAVANPKALGESLGTQLRRLWSTTRTDARDTLAALLSNFTFLKKLPIAKDRLIADDPVRARIKADRIREILPVIVFWVLFNGVVGVALGLAGVLTEPVIIIWMLIFFLFDMICVVLWCPLQLLFMKNRCCTTCQIFNWDAIMTVTPLLIIVGSLSTAAFTWPLIALALVVLARWELAFARHPERFDERTNASLSCANCHDRLCYVREPLKERLRSGGFENLRETLASVELDLITPRRLDAPDSGPKLP